MLGKTKSDSNGCDSVFLKRKRHKYSTKGQGERIRDYWSLAENYGDSNGKLKHRQIAYLGTTKNAYKKIINDKDLRMQPHIVLKIREAMHEEDPNYIVEPCKSAIKYVGGKSRRVSHYLSLFPKHKVFVSLFAGGCSVELFKPASQLEVINDFHSELTNALIAIRERKEELIRKLKDIPYSEVEFKRMVETNPTDELEKAVKYIYLSRTAFNGAGSPNVSGFSLPSGKSVKNCSKYYQNAIDRIYVMGERMRDWVILNRSFEDVIERFDSEETLFFADPPYWNKERYYNGGFSAEDHFRLNELAKKIKGKIIIAYDYHDEIHDLYKNDFQSFEYKTKIYLNPRSHGESCKDGREMIYMNYTL